MSRFEDEDAMTVRNAMKGRDRLLVRHVVEATGLPESAVRAIIEQGIAAHRIEASHAGRGCLYRLRGDNEYAEVLAVVRAQEEYAQRVRDEVSDAAPGAEIVIRDAYDRRSGSRRTIRRVGRVYRDDDVEIRLTLAQFRAAVTRRRSPGSEPEPS